MPGKGKVAYPGLVGVTPAMGAIIIPPVSVCHQVSVIGQRFFPILSSYQCQASSLIGSPTEPSLVSEFKSLPWIGSRPKLISERIAVGAVYKIFTLYFCTISHIRPEFGQVGTPSNSKDVAPDNKGPYTI